VKRVIQSDETWLSLKEAAAQMNVHTATVRRWADAGDLPHILTPGGHRRFALSAVRALMADSQPRALALTSPEAWAAKAMTHAREAMPAQAGAHWMTALDDATREKHRQVGRKLMALTLQYLTAEDANGAGAHLLDEAKSVGREYGEVSRTSGIALSDALQAALFFRDKLLEASLDLPETTQPRRSDQSKLLRRINTLLNTVQIAIAEVYESELPKRKRR
jgi:excisionase family DNA binding protein